MKKLTTRDLRVLALLSIVVPVSLLISFRLTGILPEPEPVPVRTITKEPVYWDMTRPYDDEPIVELVENFFANNETTIDFGVDVFKYHENDPTPPYGGNDVITLGPHATANVRDGFVHSMTIRFSKTDNQSVLYIYTVEQSVYSLTNLRIESVQKWSTNETEAYWKALSINQPNYTSIEILTPWIFNDKNTASHWITAILEVIYFADGAYQKVLIPITLGIGPDDNDSFETAEEIGFGSLKEYIDLDVDPADYYRIWLEQGQVVQVRVLPPSRLRLGDPEQDPQWYYSSYNNMYLYDPSREPVAHSVHGENATRQIIFTVNSTGWWYIKIEAIWAGVEQVYELNLIELSKGESS